MKRNSNNGKDSSDQNSNTSDKQLQEYRQKKHSQQQKQLNQKRKEFIENFQRLHNEFKSLLIEISTTTDPNDLAFLLVRLDTNIKGIYDLLKTTNDLEIDLDIKDLNAYATKCQNAVTNTQMLNAEVFNEYTHQLTDALAKFETKVIQLCGFSNNNNETANSDIDETNESPSTDTAYVPRMESDGDDQHEGQIVTQTSEIENLPAETFLRILWFLSPVELSKLAPTSKHFNLLANDTSLLQSYKTIRGIKFSAAYSTMISKNGVLLIFNTNACIYVFNIKKRILIARLSSILNSPDITYMYSVISDDGKYVASYCRKKDTYYIQIWSIADKKLVKEFATSQIIKSLPDNLLRFSTIVFLSEQEIGILCEERNFYTHIGTHFIKFDIEKGITSECTKYTKFSLLQNIDANLVSNFCTLLSKEFFIWGYSEHEAKVIFKSNDGTDSEEMRILSDIHFFKDKKKILCVLTNRLRQRHLVILDLNNKIIRRTLQLNKKSYHAQISAIRLTKNERYVAVCGGDHIRDSIYNTSDYFIEIHDLTKDINTCVKTLTVDGAHAVFFTEDELVVVGYEGINFFTFKDLNMEKNFEAVANKSNSSESNNDVNKKSSKLIAVPVIKPGKQEESDDEDNNNNTDDSETNDGDQKLSKIPDEILLRIFGFLSKGDLNSSSLVNRQWSKVRKDRTLVKTEKISLSSLREKLQSCSISNDQNFMIGITNNKTTYVWDIRNFSLKAKLQNSFFNSYCAISDDGKYYAMTATDLSLIHKMEILDLTTQTITQSFKLVLFSNQTISGIKFTHDNKLLVLTNKTIQTYELNGTFVRSSEFGVGLKSISFSQNGTWSVCRLSDNNLIIDKTCNFSKKASGSPNPLGLDLIGYDFACITNDGRLLISASAAGNGSFICLTDLNGNKELQDIVTPCKITSLDISENGKYIVTGEFKKKSDEYILNIYQSTNNHDNKCLLTIPFKHGITNVFFIKKGIVVVTTNDIHYIDPTIFNLDLSDDFITEAEITAMQSTRFNP